MADEKAEKKVSHEQLQNHNTKNDLWLAIHGKVYNVTDFLLEHPGGEEVLLDSGGKEATTNFEDVGHSDDARELLKKYYVGEYDMPTPAKKAEQKTAPSSTSASNTTPSPQESSFPFVLTYIIPLAFAAIGYYFYTQ